jgi:hypothetical protein
MARDRVVWDAGLLPAEIATVDALASLSLLARRNGAAIQLRGASPELCELVELAGLGLVLSITPRMATLLMATTPWSFRHQP